MIFFYELLFVLVAVGAVFIGELWSRLAAFLFLVVAVTYFGELSDNSGSYKETSGPVALMAPPT